MSPLNHTVRSAAALTAELARMTQRLTPLAGDHATALPDLTLHRRNGPTEPLHCIFPLGIALTTQGHKRVLLGKKVFSYGPGESMLTTIDLPVSAHITKATTREPYLGISLALDAGALAQVMTEVDVPRPAGTRFEPLSVQRLDEPVLDTINRLLRLLDEPAMVRHVAPLIRREILIRLLHGPHARHLSQLAATDTSRRQVADIVTWLKQHFAERIVVDGLAERANMSPSTFRQHFRTMTGMSPVQFQKRLRLQEARQLMLTQGVSAAAASALVGYESASQFNREYRRMFGAPPQRDIHSNVATIPSD